MKSTYKSTDSKVFKEQLELKANSTFSILKSESDKSGFLMINSNKE
jgi:hypothetical protein